MGSIRMWRMVLLFVAHVLITDVVPTPDEFENMFEGNFKRVYSVVLTTREENCTILRPKWQSPFQPKKETLEKLVDRGMNSLRLGNTEDAVLVLGNSGSGKTTLLQIMAGNISRLHAVRTNTSDGNDMVIVDEDGRIRIPTFRSKTLIPGLIIDTNTSTTFYDFPGFSDNRTPVTDIATNFFMKKVIDHVKRVKMLFVVVGTSLKLGNNWLDFDSLATHVVKLVKDIEKFKNGMALIATKVDSYERNRYRTHENIVNGIVGFLNGYVVALENELKSDGLTDANKEILENKIQFANAFLSNRDGEYYKIGVSRSPVECGVLQSMPLVLETKRRMISLQKNLSFAEKKDGDFSYTLRADTVLELVNFTDTINIEIQLEINKTMVHFRNNFEYGLLKQNFTEKVKSLENLSTGISQLLTRTQHESKIGTIAHEIKKGLKSLGYKTPIHFKKKLETKWEIMDFYYKIAGNNFTSAVTNVLVPVKELSKSIENDKDWNRFVTIFERIVESYEFQKEINDETSMLAGNKAALNFINSLSGNLSIESKMWTLAKENRNTGVLSKIFNFAVKTPNFTCSNGEFVVKGNFVKLTSFIKNGLIVLCPETTSVTILASKKLFFDADLNGSGKGLKVFIFSPVWEIIGDGKINLDGLNEVNIEPTKAYNGFINILPGFPGLPGKPGGNGGAFYGQFLKITDADKLLITAIGGNGGGGQGGGDGGEGWNGYDAKYENFPTCLQQHFIDDVDGVVHTEGYPFYNYKWQKMHGSPGSRGGHGGNGGAPGLGGLGGIVEIDSPTNESDINIYLAEGSLGSAGLGGRGGKGGRNGRKMHCKWWFAPIACGWRECELYESENGGFASEGNKGKNGGNQHGQIQTNLRVEIEPWEKRRKLRNFKEFLLSSLSPLEALQVFNSVQYISSTEYKTVDLAKDVLNLINQFHVSNERQEFTPFFRKMLENIRDYSTSKNENTLEHKLIWNYLYSSVLSKLERLKEPFGSSLVTDTFGYFDLVVRNMIALKDSKTAAVISQTEKTYKGKFEQKINDTLGYISNQLIPSIDNFEIEINTSIVSLLEELAAYNKYARDSLQEAKDAKIQFDHSLFKISIFSVLKSASQAVGLFCQTGVSIGSVLDSGSFLAESMVFEEPVNPSKAVLPSVNVQEYAKKLSDFAKNNENLEIKKFQAKITELSQLLDLNKDSVLENQVTVSRKILNDYKSGRIETKEFIQGKIKFHKAVHNHSDSENQAALDVLQRTFRTIDVAYDTYNKYKDDKAKLKELGDTVAQSEKNLKNYEKFRESIYDIFIPFAKSIDFDLSTAANDLRGLSSIKLEIRGWNLKRKLKDIQLIVSEFTKDFQATEEFSVILHSLEQSLNLLMDLFDSVESYAEKKEFAKYIANVNSAKANRISIENSDLRHLISQLNRSLKTDLYMSDYTKAIGAFRQFVFPFSNLYLEEYKQVVNFPQLINEQDVGQLTDFYTKKVLSMKEKLDKYKTSTLPTQYENVIQTNYTSSQPFYTWPRQKWGKSIADLLSGKKVEFKADVRKTVGGQQAVKFKVAEIHFKSSVPNLQKELDDKLKDFKVEMRHMGTSYYKIDNEYFVIRGEPQKFQWNFEYAGTRRVGTNGIYDKFERGDFLLSPYALWEVQLKPVKSGGNARFEELAWFVDFADLELVGIGNYVREEYRGLNLREFYEVDESVQD